MEACDGLSVPPVEKTSGVSPVTSNDMSAKKNSESKGRFVIRIRLQSKKSDNDGSPVQINPSPAEKDEEKKKEPWGLRPRRPWHRVPEKDKAEETKGKEIPERMRKLPVALSREEIEEDLAFLTGGKRPRKMQKRPRSARQHNDDLFPGAHLGSITVKSYNVHP
ncbi:uncharacterized protein LOC115666503 [Syzygium oleosum]|uniref:uncharacterized protein LOC115666503 n=1 Tax=Syzygium oleosum TaxID=219896 RepID=UPI0024B8E4B5|nr:uncharacterized protein LOC115666503 [Syzygium oleosum]